MCLSDLSECLSDLSVCGCPVCVAVLSVCLSDQSVCLSDLSVRVQVSLDGQLSRQSSDGGGSGSGRVIEPSAAASQAEDVARRLLPAVIALIESVAGCIR